MPPPPPQPYTDIPNGTAKGGVVFERLGVRIGIHAHGSGLKERLLEHLPECRFHPPGACGLQFSIFNWVGTTEAGGQVVYGLSAGDVVLLKTPDLPGLLCHLESHLHHLVAAHTRQALLIHAGVVSWQGRAIVMPGFSHSGKSTLVAALVKAGALYYSDEYAALDSSGLVHPYPKPLSLRVRNGRRRMTVEELGGGCGVRPLPLDYVLATTYVPGAVWSPRELSMGQAALVLLSHTVRARSDPKNTLSLLQRSLSGARAYQTGRGEAEEAVAPVLRLTQDLAH